MRTGVALVAAAMAVLGAVACDGESDADGEDELARLLETDAAYSELARTAGSDVERVMPIWTDDAVILFAGGTARATGRDEIRAFVTRMRSNPGFEVSWQADGGRVAESGELGFTYGTGTVTVPDAAGDLQTMRTNYLIVWEKQADGSWRALIDG